ncbi:MAG: serine/threonine-protein kinase [Bryobacterales bacterium]|nr:serine/threonine-protein kinase [Bryobacterales bacterium]
MEAMKPGARVGPYELVSPAGAGGMGEVWKARDTRLDRTVAIKFSNAAFSDRFQREARAIAALNHPNIATLHDVGDNYLVMEYVDGEPVRPPGDVRKLLDIAVQIADGLAAAHSAGIVHRDLKPDNILLTRQGRVKILDFGLARQTAKPAQNEATMTVITNPGSVMGTAAYMSPEQASGQELDARSDQFSFGAILYELASGKRPFQRPTAAETMAAIIREDPDPLPASVPAPFRWTIDRLLAKDPEDRYASSKDLFADLRGTRMRLSEATTVAAESAPRPARRGNRVALPGAGFVALIVALAIMLRAASESTATAPYRFTPLAATTASETLPAWSPDGRFIAYFETANGARLMVRSVDRGTAAVPLTPVRFLSMLSWSPDSERIYFSDGPTQITRIMSVARAGGQPSVVLDREAHEGSSRTSYEAAVLSPDGRSLALLVTRYGEENPSRRLAISSPPGARPKPVGEPLPCCTQPTAMSWSSDGSRLIVRIPGEAHSTIWQASPDGKLRLVNRSPGLASSKVSWLGTSRFAVLGSGSQDGEDRGLQLLDSTSGATSPLLPSPTVLANPAVSPDGKRIAYVARQRQHRLLEIPLNGEPPRELAPSHVDQHSVAMSPKRDEFAFGRTNQVLVRDRQSGQERVLVSPRDFPSAVTVPEFTWLSYSPDGTRLLFSCVGCEKSMTLWLIPLSGGAPARVAGSGDGGFGASWSPDGQWIIYTRSASGRGGSTAKLRVGGGEGSKDLSTALCVRPQWSPAGDSILCQDPAAARLLSPDGTLIREIKHPLGFASTWSPDGRFIYSDRRLPDRVVLERIDPVTSQATVVAELPLDFRPSSPIAGARLSVSADGKALAVSTQAGDGDIWILDGFQPPQTFVERLWPWKQ